MKRKKKKIFKMSSDKQDDLQLETNKINIFPYPELDSDNCYSIESIDNLLIQNTNDFYKRFNKKILNKTSKWYDKEFGDILSIYLSRCWLNGLKSFLSKDKHFDILDIEPVVCVYPALKKLGLLTTMDIRILFDETMDCLHEPIGFDENTKLNYSEVTQAATPAIYIREFGNYIEMFYTMVIVMDDIFYNIPGHIMYLNEDRENIITNFKTILKKEYDQREN